MVSGCSSGSEAAVPTDPVAFSETVTVDAGAAFFVPTIIKGGELVVLTKFDPAEVLRVIEEQKITATMLVPSMIYALMDHPDSHTRDLSSLETVYYGASAINPVRLAEAIDIYGAVVCGTKGVDWEDVARFWGLDRVAAIMRDGVRKALDASGSRKPGVSQVVPTAGAADHGVGGGDVGAGVGGGGVGGGGVGEDEPALMPKGDLARAQVDQ